MNESVISEPLARLETACVWNLVSHPDLFDNVMVTQFLENLTNNIYGEANNGASHTF